MRASASTTKSGIYDPGPKIQPPLPRPIARAYGEPWEHLEVTKRNGDLEGVAGVTPELLLFTTTKPHEGIDVYAQCPTMLGANDALCLKLYTVSGSAKVLVDAAAMKDSAGGFRHVLAARQLCERYECYAQLVGSTGGNANGNSSFSAMAGPIGASPPENFGVSPWMTSATGAIFDANNFVVGPSGLGALAGVDVYNLAGTDRFLRIYGSGTVSEPNLEGVIRVPAGGSKEVRFPTTRLRKFYTAGVLFRNSTTGATLTAGAAGELFCVAYVKQ